MLRRHILLKNEEDGGETKNGFETHIEATWEAILTAECVGYFNYVFLIHK